MFTGLYVCECCHLLDVLSLGTLTGELALVLPGISDTSQKMPLFVIYTVVPRTPSVTLNPLSDVIEIFLKLDA